MCGEYRNFCQGDVSTLLNACVETIFEKVSSPPEEGVWGSQCSRENMKLCFSLNPKAPWLG